MRTGDRKEDRKHVAIFTSLGSEERCCGCAKNKRNATHKQTKKTKS